MYNLEIKKAVNEIKSSNSKRILVQLPDGLKPKANIIQSELEKTGAEIFIWAGSCFGACDLPQEYAKKMKCDLIIQWGHSKWKY